MSACLPLRKAQGSRLVAPKFDKETRQSIAKDLSRLGRMLIKLRNIVININMTHQIIAH